MEKNRIHFPFLKNNLIYFDSSSTSLKPNLMIEEEIKYYTQASFAALKSNNVLLKTVNLNLLNAIETISSFVNATKDEIVFTYNATFASNEISNYVYDLFLEENDEIIISNLEHASNYLPWLKLKQDKGIKLKFYEVDQNGLIDFEHLKSIITSKTKAMSFASTFNTIGSTQDVAKIVKLLKENNIISIIDATQSVGHVLVDVKKWDCDFLFFSAHKCLGPTGLGVWYAKQKMFDKIKPSIVGGGMNETYNENEAKYKNTHFKMFAGTPNIAGILSFAKSVEFLNQINVFDIEKHTFELKHYLENNITNPNVEIINHGIKSSILLFKIKGMLPNSVENYFASKNIIIRSGLFCVKTKNKFVKDNYGSLRVSFHLYNTKKEVDIFLNILNNLTATKIKSVEIGENINCGLE